jgi:hypothetical protein
MVHEAVTDLMDPHIHRLHTIIERGERADLFDLAGQFGGAP